MENLASDETRIAFHQTNDHPTQRLCLSFIYNTPYDDYVGEHFLLNLNYRAAVLVLTLQVV